VFSAADGFPDPVRADLSVVDGSRDPVVVRAGLAEVGLHEASLLSASQLGCRRISEPAVNAIEQSDYINLCGIVDELASHRFVFPAFVALAYDGSFHCAN
jgi:hypothetical protein